MASTAPQPMRWRTTRKGELALARWLHVAVALAEDLDLAEGLVPRGAGACCVICAPWRRTRAWARTPRRRRRTWVYGYWVRSARRNFRCWEMRPHPWVGFTNVASGFMYWITISLFMLMQTYMGHLFIYALPSVEVAAIVGVLYNSICLLFAGFNPPAASIPRGYHWLYLITPQKYAMGLMNALAFTDCPNLPTWNSVTGEYEGGDSLLACRELTDAPITVGHTTVKEYVESNFGYKHSEIWSNFGFIFVFIAIYRLLGLLALRFVNHQKR